MKQIVTVRLIIKQDNKVLLLRRASGNFSFRGLYELPGGKVEFGETPEDAAKREAKEEIGREIETLQLHDVESWVDNPDHAKEQYICVIFFATLSPEKTIELSSDHDKYVWKTLSNIQPNTITDETVVSLNITDSIKKENVTDIDNSKIVDKNTSNYSDIVVYTDGGSRGNPGPSAAGFVIMSSQEKILFEGGEYLGITTNNQAEYQAVKFALEKALQLGARRIAVKMDSQLVVNQMHGIYKIRNRDLWPIHARIKELITYFEKVTFTHVRREFNKDADGMVNKILDERKNK